MNKQFNYRKNRARRICCVPKCRSSENRNPELHFYSFPGRPWEVERKKKWISAALLTSPTGQPWAPAAHSRICSLHFAGGEKSNDPRKEGYNPTIFPWNILERAQRTRTGPKDLQMSEAECSTSKAISHDTTDEILEIKRFAIKSDTSSRRDVETETDFLETESCEYTPDVLFRWQGSSRNQVSTQTIIVNMKNSVKKKKTRVREVIPKLARDASVGPHNKMNLGFLGFEDVKDDMTMKQLGGVTQSFFVIFLNFILPNSPGQINFFEKFSRENRLLLFLMKIKLGLSFVALGHIFEISNVTASSVFFSVLETLFTKTQKWIFWPSKEAIKKTLPVEFVNYPNCRAIIDCTELRCDTPATVEQRLHMYSNYKEDFTTKYLVGISPCGLITFISKGYGGRATDGCITNDSGFINLVEPGDEVMAAKDFPQIRSELLKRQCTLVMPPFAFDPQSVIRKIKVCRILDHINVELLPHIDKVMFIACVLANKK